MPNHLGQGEIRNPMSATFPPRFVHGSVQFTEPDEDGKQNVQGQDAAPRAKYLDAVPTRGEQQSGRSAPPELCRYAQHVVRKWVGGGEQQIEVARRTGLSKGTINTILHSGEGAGWKSVAGVARGMGLTTEAFMRQAMGWAAKHGAVEPLRRYPNLEECIDRYGHEWLTVTCSYLRSREWPKDRPVRAWRAEGDELDEMLRAEPDSDEISS